MSFEGWSSALVLGGIRSGKSAFAESLLSGAPSVRYVATSAAPMGDPAWAARIAEHQRRRPHTWATEEIGGDPSSLARLLTEAKPDEAVLVDDLGGWISAMLDRDADELRAAVVQLASAVRESAARLVLVSPEVGLSVVPPTVLGRAFADELGAANRAVAAACDAVVLVVAGQPAWLKPSAVRPPTPPVLVPTAPPAAPVSAALTESTLDLPVIATVADIKPGMHLPMPSEAAADRARIRLTRLDLAGSGLGGLAQPVVFAAGTQDREIPQPWRSVRVLLVTGEHAGGVAAGDSTDEVTRRVEQVTRGEGPLARLAAEAGAGLQVIQAPAARPVETGDALTAIEVDAALADGWRLAEQAADEGVDLLVIAALGTGAAAAAVAVTAVTTGAELVNLLGRVPAPGGMIDDNAWMTRCAAVRDALHRTRSRPRNAHDVLAGIGGGDIAVVTGALLGAAARRTPVLLDGPVGVAAALVSRDLGGQARHWCILADDAGHPMVTYAADVLGLRPVTQLKLDLGEGVTALAALPLLRTALAIAAGTPEHPALLDPAPPEPDPEVGAEAAADEAPPSEADEAPPPGSDAASTVETGHSAGELPTRIPLSTMDDALLADPGFVPPRPTVAPPPVAPQPADPQPADSESTVEPDGPATVPADREHPPSSPPSA